jgi:hypothetical protein
MMMKVKDEKQTVDLDPSSMISIEVYYINATTVAAVSGCYTR